MEIQTINLLANVPQTFMIPAKFLEIIEAPYPVSIAFFDRNGNTFADGGLVNAESGIFVDLRDGNGWGSITVTSTLAQTIKLLIGSMIGGSRRQPGVVQVVDGGRVRTLAQQAFMANLFSGAAAGQYAHVMLWNPVGSTRRLILKRFGLVSSTSGGVQWNVRNTALANLDGLGLSKLAGGPASVAERRNEAPAANILTNPNFMGSSATQPNVPLLIDLAEPVILPPGWGFMVQAQFVASLLGSFMDYIEEQI